jgi:DNA-binding CsgD family transcriptional regulator/PAS domain-containing protein
VIELHQLEDADGRHARWVAMWQEAVRASRSAMGLAELASARFLELSPRGAELLGTTVEGGAGLSYLDVVEPSHAAAESFRLAREGILDGTRTRRRLRRPDGSTVDVQSTGWAIRSPAGADLGLWLASEVPASVHAAVADDVVAPSFPRHPASELNGDRVTLDNRWRVTHVRSSGDSLLGRRVEELLSTSLIELTHPDDIAALLFALARATTDESARALVRLRHQDGTWRVIQTAPAVLEGDGTRPVAFTFAAEEEPGASEPGVAGDIPGLLRRIADQIEAANLLAPLAETSDALGVASTTDLTPRQWEIVSRLVRGQRVAAIAAEIYLSPNTVRNHLSTIFAKVGVHSQSELLALYRNERRNDPSDRR